MGSNQSQTQEPPTSSRMSTTARTSPCPVMHKKGKNEESNVNPANQMPDIPNKVQSSEQTRGLSTERVHSTILKPSGETWSYPSPQMFYNALVRKGKAQDVREEDMDVIVAVHNNMNELAWHDVLRWEALRTSVSETKDSPSVPTLSKFIGRPNDLTPKAWVLSNIFGYQKPFDRHDWTIERNGQSVRYVVDFYYDEEKGKEDETPGLHDIHAVKSISIDARPAIDSFESLVDRIQMPILELLGKEPDISHLLVEPEAVTQSSDSSSAETVGMEEQVSMCPIKRTKPKPEVVPTNFDGLNAEELSSLSNSIQTKCAKAFAEMNKCDSEEKCQLASFGTLCCSFTCRVKLR
mmetsp:Transcript_3184/g.3590  ORF Transcript_3184/g.3590 Transcript_3184/m.3590 type:complete len:350 (-) Transcript_3184:714-1763(-)